MEVESRLTNTFRPREQMKLDGARDSSYAPKTSIGLQIGLGDLCLTFLPTLLSEEKILKKLTTWHTWKCVFRHPGSMFFWLGSKAFYSATRGLVILTQKANGFILNYFNMCECFCPGKLCLWGLPLTGVLPLFLHLPSLSFFFPSLDLLVNIWSVSTLLSVSLLSILDKLEHT